MYIYFTKNSKNEYYISNPFNIFYSKKDAIIFANKNIILLNNSYVVQLNLYTNIFNDIIFLKYYKQIYIEEHIKYPIIYPIKYIYEYFHIKKKDNFEYKINKTLELFLNSLEDCPNYCESNCIVNINKNNYINNENNIENNENNLENNENNLENNTVENNNIEYIYICIHKTRENILYIYTITNNFIDALFLIIRVIIKQHEFYILDNKIIFLSTFWILKINIDKNNEYYPLDIIYKENWYDIIMNINLLLQKNNFVKEDIEYLLKETTKFNISYKNSIPPILYEELLISCKKANNIIKKYS